MPALYERAQFASLLLKAICYISLQRTRERFLVEVVIEQGYASHTFIGLVNASSVGETPRVLRT